MTLDNQFSFEDSSEISKRKIRLIEFLDRIFDKEDRPYLVSDDACLYDIYAGDNASLIQRCHNIYGKKLTENDFRIPVWKLLDVLYS